MFNVKLLKIHDFLGREFYINLNYLVSFCPDTLDTFLTVVNLVNGSSYRIDMCYQDFVDYLVDLSEAQKGGDSE